MGSYDTLKDFGQEGKVRDEPEVCQIPRSRLGVFRMGLMAASLKDNLTELEVMKKLMMRGGWLGDSTL